MDMDTESKARAQLLDVNELELYEYDVAITPAGVYPIDFAIWPINLISSSHT